MRRIAIAILGAGLLALPASAQLPRPVNIGSSTINASANTCATVVNVTSGNKIIVASQWFSSTNTPSVSDTRSSSWTQVLLNTSNSIKIGIYVASLGSSGSETVTFSVTSATFQQVLCVEVANMTTTTDGTNSGSFSGTPSSVTCASITTSVDADFVFSFIGGLSNTGFMSGALPQQMLGFQQNEDSMAGTWRISGNNGSTNDTFANRTNSGGTCATVAFKSGASFAFTTTALPDAAAGSAYSYTLTTATGVGAVTCSLTGGTFPSGMSLSGCTITGTPTSGPSSSSLTFQATDGSANTASTTLALHLGGSLQTISVLQSKSTSSAATLAFTSNVTSGSLIHVSTAISDGVSTKMLLFPITDTLGTPFVVRGSYAMSSGGAASPPEMIVEWEGKAPSGGADTVSINGTSAAPPLSIIEISNAQDFLDVGDVTTGSGVTSGTFTSNNSTTLVANEILVSDCSSYTQPTALSVGSPFTDVGAVFNGKGVVDNGYDVVTAATTYSVTCTVATNTDGRWGTVIEAFRPTVTGTAPAGGQPHHSSIL